MNVITEMNAAIRALERDEAPELALDRMRAILRELVEQDRVTEEEVHDTLMLFRTRLETNMRLDVSCGSPGHAAMTVALNKFMAKRRVVQPQPKGPTPGDLEFLSWFGYRPDGTCPMCGKAWTAVMFAYDGPCCAV